MLKSNIKSVHTETSKHTHHHIRLPNKYARYDGSVCIHTPRNGNCTCVIIWNPVPISIWFIKRSRSIIANSIWNRNDCIFLCFFTSFWFGTALFLVQISLSWMWFYRLQICCTFRLSAIAALIFECVCLYTDNIWIKSIISDILQCRLFYFSFFSLTHTCRSG